MKLVIMDDSIYEDLRKDGYGSVVYPVLGGVEHWPPGRNEAVEAYTAGLIQGTLWRMNRDEPPLPPSGTAELKPRAQDRP